jgi:hypothetical protein
MEGLAPTLRCALEVRFALENGESVRAGIIRAVSGYGDPFSQAVQRWLFALDQGQNSPLETAKLTAYQRNLVALLGHGLRGNSIRPQLLDLESEIEQACRDQIDNFIRMLPFKMAIPVLLLQFPAFLLLLLGPLIAELAKGLQ